MCETASETFTVIYFLLGPPTGLPIFCQKLPYSVFDVFLRQQLLFKLWICLNLANFLTNHLWFKTIKSLVLSWDATFSRTRTNTFIFGTEFE